MQFIKFNPTSLLSEKHLYLTQEAKADTLSSVISMCEQLHTTAWSFHCYLKMDFIEDIFTLKVKISRVICSLLCLPQTTAFSNFFAKCTAPEEQLNLMYHSAQTENRTVLQVISGNKAV